MPNSFIEIIHDPNYDDKQKIALLQEGINSGRSSLDEKGSNGESLLHAACLHNGPELLEWLVTQNPKLLLSTSKQGNNPLFYAAKYSNKNAIEYFLKHNTDLLNASNDDGKTILFFAALSGNIELFKQLQVMRGDWLLSIHKDNFLLVENLVNLLELIIRSNHLAMFEFLLQVFNPEIIKNFGKPITEIPNKNGHFLFYLAAQNGNIDIVRYLVNSVFDFDHFELTQKYISQPQEDEWGNTAIHIAAIRGHLAVVDFLAQCQIDFNQPNKQGKYLLHAAVEANQLAVVKHLVKNLKVDVNQLEKNESENSALFRAIIKGYLLVAECLIKLGASYHKPNKRGCYPLHEACVHNHLPIVRYLVEELKVDINQPTVINDGTLQMTALSIAAANGNLEIIQYLTTHGAVDFPSYIAVPALHATACKGQQKIAEWLINQGRNINVSGSDRETIVHIAAYNGHLAYLKFVIEKHKAEYMQTNNRGYLPFHIAISRGHLPIVKYFIVEKGISRETITWSLTPKSPWQLALESKNISVITYFYQPILLHKEEFKHFFRKTSHQNQFILIYCILANAHDLNETYNELKNFQVITDLEVGTILEKFKEELFQHAKVQREFMQLHNCDYTTVLYIEEAAKLLQNVAMVCKNFTLPGLLKDLHNEILSYLIPNAIEYKKITPQMIIDAKHPQQSTDFYKNKENKHKFSSKLFDRIRFFDKLNQQFRLSAESNSTVIYDEDGKVTKKQRK